MKNLVKVPMREIKEKEVGYWFGHREMKAFDCTLPRYGYAAANGAVYFWSGEQFHYKNTHAPRRFTVRMLHPDSLMIETVSEFQAYDTAREANLEARRLATQE